MNRAKPLVLWLLPVTALSAVRPAVAAAQDIRAGQSISAQLTATDPKAADGSHYDDYAYTGAAGDRIVITLRSTDFDAVLFWGRGRGTAFVQEAGDDDGAGGTDSRLEVTVGSGSWTIRVNALRAGETGAYTLSVEAAGGTAGTRAAGGGAAGGAAASTPIGPGETVAGRLERSDPVLNDDSHYDYFTYTGSAGDRIVITLRSRDFDALLSWGTLSDGRYLTEDYDDDSGGGTDSRLEVAVGSDRYTIRVNSLGSGETGAYELQVQRVGGAAPAPAARPGATEAIRARRPGEGPPAPPRRDAPPAVERLTLDQAVAQSIASFREDGYRVLYSERHRRERYDDTKVWYRPERGDGVRIVVIEENGVVPAWLFASKRVRAGGEWHDVGTEGMPVTPHSTPGLIMSGGGMMVPDNWPVGELLQFTINAGPVSGPHNVHILVFVRGR